jgi:hypothetical protein
MPEASNGRGSSLFGDASLCGRIIKRAGNTWSATFLDDPHGTYSEWDAKSQSMRVVEPNSHKVRNTTDWSVIWEKINRDGIADIRDDSEIPHSGVVLDGICYVPMKQPF